MKLANSSKNLWVTMTLITSAKLNLILIGLITMTGCGTLKTKQIINTIDNTAKFQANQSLSSGANIKDLNYIYTAFETYAKCLESLTESQKINSQQKSELLKVVGQKFREYNLPDVRQVKVYSAVTNKFCN